MGLHQVRRQGIENHEAAIWADSRRGAGAISFGAVRPDGNANSRRYADGCGGYASITQEDIAPAVTVTLHQIVGLGSKNDEPAARRNRRRTVRTIRISAVPSNGDRNYLRRARAVGAEAAITQENSRYARSRVDETISGTRGEGLIPESRLTRGRRAGSLVDRPHSGEFGRCARHNSRAARTAADYEGHKIRNIISRIVAAGRPRRDDSDEKRAWSGQERRGNVGLHLSGAHDIRNQIGADAIGAVPGHVGAGDESRAVYRQKDIMIRWCGCAARRDRSDRGTHGGCGAKIGVVFIAAERQERYAYCRQA